MHRTTGCLPGTSGVLLAVAIILPIPSPSLWAQNPPVTDIAFAPDGKSLVSCSQQGLQVFSWPGLKLQNTVEASSANLHCLGFSPDGTRLAVGGGDPSEEGLVEVFSWPDCQSRTKLSYHDDSVVSIVWRDNRDLVSAGLDRLLVEWNLQTNQPTRTLRGHSRGVSAVCLPGNGDVVSAGHDQSVRVWDGESGELLRSLNQHSRPVNSIAVCPAPSDNPLVATAAGDRTIRFWQPAIGRMMRYIRLESEPLDIAWLNENRLVASCVDGKARFVDVDNVKVRQTIPVIDGWAYAVASHPTDGSVAIAGSNGQIRRVVPEPDP